MQCLAPRLPLIRIQNFDISVSVWCRRHVGNYKGRRSCMLICVTVFSTPPIFGQNKFEELVYDPRDCCRRDLEHDACRRAGEKAGETTEPVNCPRRRHNAVDLFALSWHGAAFLCVQQRLADVERSGQSGSDCAGNAAGKHVRQRPVLAVAVRKILCELVDNEVKALIGNVEHKLCAKTVVEGSPSFPDENCPGTVEAGPVRCSIDLQALLNHCNYITPHLQHTVTKLPTTWREDNCIINVHKHTYRQSI